MLDFKGKFCAELLLKLTEQKLTLNENGFEDCVYDEVAIQQVIDDFVMPMPDLTPRQFKYMLAASGIYPTMDAVALVLQSMSLELYAQVVSQLDGGTVYFWQKSLDLCNQLKPLILQQNPNLNLDEANLRVLWTLASMN